jgi:hypothetical protein
MDEMAVKRFGAQRQDKQEIAMKNPSVETAQQWAGVPLPA